MKKFLLGYENMIKNLEKNAMVLVAISNFNN